ncbi:MAG: TolC family protein [Spirochaetes bacterium]|nr:TolC family protein [Spirochaetota bacterium]
MDDRLRHGARVVLPLFLLLSAISFAVAENPTETVTLTQALQAALQGGPDAKITGLTLEAAQVQYDQAVAQSSPSLDGNASAGYSRDKADSLGAGLSFSLPRTMTSADVSASYGITHNAFGAELRVGQTIWDGYGSPIDGGKSAASLKQSALSLQVKELSVESSRQDVISKVKQAYYALLSAQHTVTARREALSQQQAQYERTKALADNQLATSLDVRQAEINARTSELDLATSEAALTASRRTLSLAAGWPGDRLYTVAEAPDPVAPALDIAALVATAMEKRIDVRQQELNAQSAAITLALRKAAKSPTVSANGSVSLVTWSFGVSGQIPLIDSGLTAAQVRETEISNETARHQAAQLAETVTTEVTVAVTDLKDLLARAELATARRDLARARYELAQAKLGLGIGSTLDVLDALVSLTEADVSLSKTKSDVYLGILRLQDAIGTIEE